MNLVINTKCFIRETKKGLFLIANGEIYNITNEVLDIIYLCNGQNGVEQICTHFSNFTQRDIVEVIDFLIDEGIVAYTKKNDFVLPIVDEKYPTSITIELTYRCNEQCAFCISDAGRKFYNQTNIIDMELQKSDINRILEQMHELKISLLTLTGGEPLLRKELLYYTIYEAQRKNINVALLTNGTLIDEKISRELSEFSNLTNVQISLDGADNTTHDFLRHRKGSFDESVNAINFLKENGIEPSISFVLNKLNYEQYPDVILLAEQLDLQLRIAPVVPIGRGKENSDYLLTNKQITEFLKYTHRANDGKLSARIMPRERCSITTSPAIDPFGNIYPCMHMKFSEFKLGNIRSDKLKIIWDNSPVVKELQDYNKHKNSDCKSCWNKYICDGCIGVAYSYYQTIYKRDPYRCVANRNYTKSLLSEGDSETKEQVESMIDEV